MKGIFSYIDADTVVHRLNPVVKLALSFGLCAACFITRSHLVLLGILAVDLTAAAIAGTQTLRRGLRVVTSLTKLAALMFVVQLLFISEGNVLLSLPPGIIVTDTGLLFSLLFVMRFVIATAPLALMFSVTRVTDISNALVRSLRVPYKYAFAVTAAIRFIPLFASEMDGIVEAQTARGVEFDTRSLFKKIKLLLPLCVPLLVMSVRKIEGAAISAELRGFNLRTRSSGYRQYPFRARDYIALAGCAALVVACVLI